MTSSNDIIIKNCLKPEKVSAKTSVQKKVTLYLNDDSSKPVTAAGVLFYKKVGKNLMLLVIDNQGKYEDIGGKIDSNDTNILTAVCREIEEETNAKIKSENVLERLRTSHHVYVPRSKYLIYLLEANDYEKELKKEDFGDCEENNGSIRTIGWISREELTKTPIIQYKMNRRLKSKDLMDKLVSIENMLKLKNNNLFKNMKK